MPHGGKLDHDMEYHPLASIFPLLPDPKLQELADDIRDHGLKEPIWTFEGKIIDGRNRAAACVIAGVEPGYREFKGTRIDAVHHVWSLNCKRRHLNSSQAAIAETKRAKIVEEYAAEIERLRAEQPKGGRPKKDEKPTQQIESVSRNERSTDAIRAKSAGTNRQYIRDAEKIIEEHPEYVEKIEAGELTIPQANREIRVAARNEILREMEWPEGKYRVLYADPPWRYEHCKTSNRRIENQYPTMDLDAICHMKISEITTPDSVLFLWATSPKLYEAMSVVDAWDFTYRTCIVWDKERIGMGYYARQQHETLLICTKGSPSVPVVEHRPCSVIRSPREGHSRKPDRFRELIDAMYPYGPRIELFARTKRGGWDVWGNEVQANSETQPTDSLVPQTQITV